MTMARPVGWPSARSSRRLLRPNAVSDTASQHSASRNQVQFRLVSAVSDSARAWRPMIIAPTTALRDKIRAASWRHRGAIWRQRGAIWRQRGRPRATSPSCPVRAGGDPPPCTVNLPRRGREGSIGRRRLCPPLASGAPPTSPAPLTGTAFPRRSFLAPQSRRRRAPPARSLSGRREFAWRGWFPAGVGRLRWDHRLRCLAG
jgi:hypothetical protein